MAKYFNYPAEPLLKQLRLNGGDVTGRIQFSRGLQLISRVDLSDECFVNYAGKKLTNQQMIKYNILDRLRVLSLLDIGQAVSVTWRLLEVDDATDLLQVIYNEELREAGYCREGLQFPETLESLRHRQNCFVKLFCIFTETSFNGTELKMTQSRTYEMAQNMINGKKKKNSVQSIKEFFVTPACSEPTNKVNNLDELMEARRLKNNR